MGKPISIQNVQGNVIVTIVEGNNNQTQISINDFIEKTVTECGLKLIYEDTFKQNSNTTYNFKEWLKGFPLDLKSVYYGREYRREKIIYTIEKKLEENQRLLILGESGTSKSVILMEVLCDYLKKGYKILHNLDPTASGVISNLDYLENTISLLIKNGNNVIVIVDNVHNKQISAIFSLIQKIKNDHHDKLDKIKFLLSARQPEFRWAMDRGIFDSDTIERIDMLFEEVKRYNIPYFSKDEIKYFIEKYEEYLHPSKRNKSIEENAQEIYEDTQGHPIMVRFSVLQDGLRTHVKRMYTDYLIQKDGESNSPNIERIKSVIACSLYDISSIPLTEDELYNKLDLKKPSLQIINTMIKRTENSWTTIHPRWDLELFKYMFSLNEADRIEIQEAFGSILTKILEVQRMSSNQLLILNTLYKTIAVDKFIDIKIIQEMIKEDDIEKKLDYPYFRILFFANILGIVFNKLKNHEYATKCYDKAIKVKSPYVDDYIKKGYADAFSNKGNALSSLGRNEEAIACFDKAIEINPKFADAYNNKGIALSALGRNEEAIACFDKTIEINPQHAKTYYNKGLTLSSLGKNEEAIACFDKAIELDPKYAKTYNNKGLTLSSLGRNEEAIACFDKAIELDLENATTYNNKGIALSDLGKNKEAIACFDKVIEIDPQYADAHYNKGLTLSHLGRKEEAMECYDKAIEIDPQHAFAYNNKGNALSALGRKEEAIVCYDKAIEIDPQHADAYIIKGLTLSSLGKNEEAIACFDKAIEIDPQNADAYLAKGILLALGRKEDALECYDKAIDINPQYASAHYNKGIALSALGRNEEAIACFDKVIDIDAHDAKTYNNKGIALSDLGRNKEAIACFDKAIEINPQYADAYISKGNALSALGRYEEAIVCDDKTIEINPQDALAYYNKGLALSDFGRNEEAIGCYDKALAIDPNYSDAINGKAFALSNLGKNEEALPLIEKALETDSSNEYYLSTAAFIMYNLGRYDQAKNYYNKALDINPNLKDTLSESEN